MFWNVNIGADHSYGGSGQVTEHWESLWPPQKFGNHRNFSKRFAEENMACYNPCHIMNF